MGKKNRKWQKETPKRTENMIKYTEYILQNKEDLCKKVDDRIRERSSEIREKIFDSIRKILLSGAKHYEWKYDGCPYDSSGILVENGEIDLNQTVSEFLENEYTGCSVATFESGHGLNYETYDDDLSYDTQNIGEEIMDEVLKQKIADEFGCEVDEDEWFEIMDDCHDEIYDNCMVRDFFFCEGLINVVGGGDVMLKDLVKKVKRGGKL